MNEQKREGLVEGMVRWIRAVQENRRLRDGRGVFWVEGVRQFISAWDAGWEFESLLVSEVLLKNSLVEKLVRRLSARGVRRVGVTPEMFRKVTLAERASGIGAVVRQRWVKLADARAGKGLCWIVIERLRTAGNLGTILRTAEAVGVGGVIFLEGTCDPFDPVVVRPSMGGVFGLDLVRTSRQQLAQWAKEHRVSLVGLSPDAQRLWTEVPHGSVGIVLGEERQGLSPGATAMCDLMVRLPMTGRADSLNVGIAAGVMMYEMVRRRCLQ